VVRGTNSVAIGLSTTLKSVDSGSAIAGKSGAARNSGEKEIDVSVGMNRGELGAWGRLKAMRLPKSLPCLVSGCKLGAIALWGRGELGTKSSWGSLATAGTGFAAGSWGAIAGDGAVGINWGDCNSVGGIKLRSVTLADVGKVAIVCGTATSLSNSVTVRGVTIGRLGADVRTGCGRTVFDFFTGTLVAALTEATGARRTAITTVQQIQLL
jgi:hypothetical protein